MLIIGKVMAPLFAVGAVIGIAAGVILWSPPEPVAAAGVVQQAQPASTPVADGIRPLGNKFVRAFHFDNTSKSWLWYDPEVPSLSTLENFVTGRPYYILVNADTTLATPSRPAPNPHNLTCSGSGANRNCWNNIGW